jgi:hypothetical protein
VSNPPLPEQRQKLHDCIKPILESHKINVEKYPRDDPIPPVAMIIDPRMIFPDNSKVALVEWSIRLYEVRKAPSGVSFDFDAIIGDLLLPLGKGMGMGYVLNRVENTILTDAGYQLPGYVIIGNCPLANC